MEWDNLFIVVIHTIATLNDRSCEEWEMLLMRALKAAIGWIDSRNVSKNLFVGELEVNRKTPPPGSNRLSPETMASRIIDGDSTPVGWIEKKTFFGDAKRRGKQRCRFLKKEAQQITISQSPYMLRKTPIRIEIKWTSAFWKKRNTCRHYRAWLSDLDTEVVQGRKNIFLYL